MDLQLENPVEFLESASFRILKIAIPVIITLLIDAVFTRFLEQTHGAVELDRSFSETMSYSDQGISTEWSIYLALIMIGAIVVVTAIIVALYWFGCLKILFGWMMVAVTLLLSFYVYTLFGEVPGLLNVPCDWLSFVLLCLNLVVVGNMSIFWRAPLIITQVFLVFISVMIALVFLSLPDWTIWILLVLLVAYDAIVVLCPGGLLNILVKKSEERGDELPALVYSSAAWIHHEEEEEEEFERSSSSTSSSGSTSSSSVGSEQPAEAPPEIGQEIADGTSEKPQVDSEQPPVDSEQPPADTRPNRGRGRGRGRGSARGRGGPRPTSGNSGTLNDPERPRRAPRPRPEGDTDGERPRRSHRPRPDGDPNPERVHRKRAPGEAKKTKKKEREGVRLGLGDFCFYGILVTRAARLGWDLVVLCVFAVVLGLSLTLICLAWLQRALPALPFSLVLGIIFFLTGAFTFRKFDLSIRETLVGF
jgi:presenilin 1